MLSAAGLDLEVEDMHHDTGFLVEQNDVAPECFFGQCWATNPYPHRVELPRIDPWGSAPISFGVAVSL
jgi:hypothetical protein